MYVAEDAVRLVRVEAPLRAAVVEQRRVVGLRNLPQPELAGRGEEREERERHREVPEQELHPAHRAQHSGRGASPYTRAP